jgi:hypothetical protein
MWQLLNSDATTFQIFVLSMPPHPAMTLVKRQLVIITARFHCIVAG